jgi:phage terminase small subunit
MADKIKALELLGKHLGMFTDRLNVNAEMAVKIVDDINGD